MTINRMAQSADFIFRETVAAMQQAEELGGCRGVVYVELMEAISRMALQRARTYATQVHRAAQAALAGPSLGRPGGRVVSFDLKQLEPVAKEFGISTADVQTLCAYCESGR